MNEVKLAGGKPIQKNLISGTNPEWTNIHDEIKYQCKPFNILELFGKHGMLTIHHQALKGKQIIELRLGVHLTVESWKVLSVNVYYNHSWMQI
jgi:hypothetical protein